MKDLFNYFKPLFELVGIWVAVGVIGFFIMFIRYIISILVEDEKDENKDI